MKETKGFKGESPKVAKLPAAFEPSYYDCSLNIKLLSFLVFLSGSSDTCNSISSYYPTSFAKCSRMGSFSSKFRTRSPMKSL